MKMDDNALEEYAQEVERALSSDRIVGTLQGSSVYRLGKRRSHQRQGHQEWQSLGTRYFAQKKSAESRMREEIYRDIFQAIGTNSNLQYVYYGELLRSFSANSIFLLEPNWDSIRKDFYCKGSSTELRDWFLNDGVGVFGSIAQWQEYSTMSTRALSAYSYQMSPSKVSSNVVPEKINDPDPWAPSLELHQEGIRILAEALLGNIKITSVLSPEIEEAISIALVLGAEFEAIQGTSICVVNGFDGNKRVLSEIERCFTHPSHAEVYALLLSALHTPWDRVPWKVAYSPEEAWAGILSVNSYLTKHPAEMKYRETKYKEMEIRQRHESQISSAAEWMKRNSYADLLDFFSVQERDREETFNAPRYTIEEHRVEEDFVLTEDHLLAIENAK